MNKILNFRIPNNTESSYTIELLAVILLLFFLPLLISNQLINGTITAKFIFFQFGVFLLIPLTIYRLTAEKVIRIKYSKLDLSLSTLVLFYTINRFLIQDRLGFSIRYSELVSLSMFYLILRTVKRRFFYYLLLIIVLSGIIQALYGNLQLLGYLKSNHSNFNMTGSFFNPAPYAGFLSITLLTAIGIYLFKSEIRKALLDNGSILSKTEKRIIEFGFKYIAILGIFTIAIVIPSTQSRAAWISLFIAICFLLIYTNRKIILSKFSKIKLLSLTIASVLLFAFSAYFLYLMKSDSANGRLIIWKVSSRIIADHPLLGLGIDSFSNSYMNYQADYFKEEKLLPETKLASNVDYAFNEYLQLIIENGILGLFILIIICILIFLIRAYDNHRYITLLCKTALLSIGIFACFSYPMHILPIKILLVFFLACISTMDSQKFQVVLFSKKNVPRHLKNTLIGSSLLIMAMGFSHTYIMYYGFKNWKKSYALYKNEDYTNSIEGYKSVLDTFYNNGDFLEEFGRALYLNKKNDRSKEVLEKAKLYTSNTALQTTLGETYKSLGNFNKAEEAYKLASNMVPSLFYPKYLLAVLYRDTEQYKKAIQISKKILQMPVKVRSKAVIEIKQEALTILKQHFNN